MNVTQKTAVRDGRPTRNVTGLPETDADRRFFDLREHGYSGPIDQDGHPVASLWPNEPAPAGVGTTLRDAARYLSRYGWIQGCYYDATATVFTPAACMVGAIAVVCYGRPVEAPAEMFDDPGFGDFEAAYTWLDRHLLDRHGVISYEFNDAKGRARAEVIAALTAAADQWEQLHAAALVAHADYPHEPGWLYDCPGCEARCFCTPDSTECVHCAIRAEHGDTNGGAA